MARDQKSNHTMYISWVYGLVDRSTMAGQSCIARREQAAILPARPLFAHGG